MEAPNQIKFQSPLVTQTQFGIPSSDSAFKQIFADAAKSIQKNESSYNPPSPKRGVTWLEVNQGTPFKDVQQKMARLKEPGLLKLSNLNANDIGFKPILTDAKSNQNIRHLIIRHSNFHQHQIDLIKNVLKLNDGIAWLVLDHNDIDDTQLKELMNDIHPHNKVEHLVLSQNNITDNGLNDLLNKLPSLTSLKTIWLDNNPLTDKGVKKMMQYIKSNPTLQTISVKGIHLNKDLKSELINVCNQINCRCYC